MSDFPSQRRLFWINVAAVLLSVLAASLIGLGLYEYRITNPGGFGGSSSVTPGGSNTSSAGSGGGQPTSTGTSSSSSSQLSTSITLVETMNVWNRTAPPQPSFFLLGPKGLESTANIIVPANKLIQLTILSYDTPTNGSTNQQGMVTGTVGGNVYFMNGTIATMGTMNWRQNLTSVPGAVLAHTFTIPLLGINIPVIGGSTVIAYLYFTKAGTYVWICLTPCGFGPLGDQGSMSTSGWMIGQLTVK